MHLDHRVRAEYQLVRVALMLDDCEGDSDEDCVGDDVTAAEFVNVSERIRRNLFALSGAMRMHIFFFFCTSGDGWGCRQHFF